MMFRPVLLASVLGLLIGGPAVARDAAPRSEPVIVIAQNNEICEPGSECAGERRKGGGNKARERRVKRGDNAGQGKAERGKQQREKAQQRKAEPRKAKPAKRDQREEQADRPKRNGNGKGQRSREEQGNERQPAGKQQRRRPAAAAPAEAEPRAAPKKKAAEQRQDRQLLDRQQRPQERRDEAKTPARPKRAEKPREGRQPPAAAEQRSRRPAVDRDAAPQRVAPASPAKLEAREERRRERADRRKQRRRDIGDRPARQPERDASTVERQLAAQGRAEEAQRVRELRRKLRRQREAGQARREERRDDAADRGERRRDRRDREVVERRDDRVIVRFGANLFIQPQEPDDRLLWRARDVEVEDLPGGFTRTVVYRDNGVRIVTVRDPYGDIVSRTRYLPDGREVVLIGQQGPDYVPLPYPTEIALPPLVVPIPRAEYIVETRVATPVEIETALTAPPVETVERAYSLEEVRGSDRLRDKMRRVDLDTITFEFGSAVIEPDQLDALDRVGEAIEETLRNDPDEVFLIEGHTDAVGSAEDNLVLSDRRAEAVAVALSEDFDIPPENLVTQGYGEDQLKLVTEAPERQNRRVALRRITPLLRGVAQQ